MIKKNTKEITKEDKNLLLEIIEFLKKDQASLTYKKINFLLEKYPENQSIIQTASSIYKSQGKLTEATKLLDNIIKNKEADHNTYFLQADNYAAIGDIRLVEKYILLAIKENPSWKEAYKFLFRVLLNNQEYIPSNISEIDTATLEVLKHNYVELSDIKDFIEKNFIRQYNLHERSKVLKEVIIKNPSKSLEEVFINDISILNNGVLLSLLSKVSLSNPYLEEYLTLIRKIIFQSHKNETIDEYQQKELKKILISLNYQNLLNGSIWERNEKENHDFILFLEKINNEILKKKNIDEFIFLLLGSYLPLQNDKNIRKYIEKKFTIKNPNLFILIEYYKELEKKEKRAIKKIDQNYEILNKNSLEIMQYYDNYPCKHWSKVILNDKTTLVEFLRNSLHPIQLLGEKKAIKNPHILYVGCGSGREAILLSSIPGSQMDAIDLSIKNLSYAAMKAEEHKVININFIKLDFLEVTKLKKEYDLIIIDEVLGEIENIKEGLELIPSILKPGGLVKVHLKSGIADERNKNLRNLVNSKNSKIKKSDAISIRSEIIKTKNNDFNQLVNNKYIHNINTLYHLLVPTYRSVINIKLISDLIKKNNFTFLGWADFIENPDLKYKIIKLYSNNYPDDDFLKNLDNWYDFEEQNPIIFSNMYKFWMTRK